MSLKKLLLLSVIILFNSIPSSLFSQGTPFINLGYEPSIHSSYIGFRNTDEIVENNQFVNVGSLTIGAQWDKFYFYLGAKIHKRQLALDCLVQVIDTISIISTELIPAPNGSCEYAYIEKDTFLEFPLGVGLNFYKKKNYNGYFELVYEPLFLLRGNRTLTDNLTNEVSYREHSSIRKRSWLNFSTRLGLSRKLTKKLYLNTGLFLKINDFELDNFHVGADLRLQYRFGKKR